MTPKVQTLTVRLKSVLAGGDRLSKTLGYYWAFIILGLVTASLGPTLPGLAEQTSANLGAIGFLFTARALGYLLGSLLGGRLYDRVAGHPVFATVLGVLTVMMLLVPFTPLLWFLTGILFVVGMAESIIDVGGNTLLVWVYREKVGPFMNALHFFFGVGAFLSPLIVGWAIALYDDISVAYWVLAALILPVGVWFVFLPGPAARAAASIDQAGKVPLLLVGSIALFLFLYVGVEVGFGGWIYTYTLTLNLVDKARAAYLTSAFWGALTVGRLLSIPLAVRLRPVMLLFGSLTGGLLSIGVMLLAPYSLPAIWVGTLGLGVSLAAIFPTMLSFSGRRMSLTGQVTGCFFAGASLGAMTVPWLIGQLLEAMSPLSMMVVLLGVLLSAVMVLTGICVGLRGKQDNNGKDLFKVQNERSLA